MDRRGALESNDGIIAQVPVDDNPYDVQALYFSLVE